MQMKTGLEKRKIADTSSHHVMHEAAMTLVVAWSNPYGVVPQYEILGYAAHQKFNIGLDLR